MYLNYWSLKKPPFDSLSDPDFFYLSAEIEEALSRLRYVVERNKGAALLTGERGCGKTTLLLACAEILRRDNSSVLLVSGPFSNPIEFLKEVVRGFGSQAESNEQKSDLLHLVQSNILQNASEKKKTVFLIDDAEGMSKETLQELRLLLNVFSDNSLPVTMILSGHPTLSTHVGELKDLDQRIAIRCHLEPMDFEETSGYISHRLKTAGAERRIFTFEAMVEIHGYTAGIPAKVNILCNRCLEKGSVVCAAVIDADIVHDENK
jgi:general secretion pathway protein A